jgi:HisJ family histidinol phosphate phosphatase
MERSHHVWETHGIHVGTGDDHVRHGIDDVDSLVERAVSLGRPSVTFIIHSPRLTRFRYASERATKVKFIRGDAAYFDFAPRMAALRERHAGRIAIRYGVELEWLGPGLGVEWSRAKLFQAPGLDFVVCSVHFSRDGIPYDGSKAETEELIRRRGGLEGMWASYFDEAIEMVDALGKMISVVGHLDLPKLFAPVPECFKNLEEADDECSRRLFSLLEMMAEKNLALDVNLSGLRKGVGIYPDLQILRRAFRLGIPVALGTDSHSPEEMGAGYEEVIRRIQEAGYRYYVSFSRGIPEKRPLGERGGEGFRMLNLSIEMLNQRFDRRARLEIPQLSFGGDFRSLAKVFTDSSSLGAFHAVRVRRQEKSLAVTDRMPGYRGGEIRCLYSRHTDIPGTLAILFNTLASEEINVETAYLDSIEDGTATAYLTLEGRRERIREAVDFVRGTAADRFFEIEPELSMRLPPLKKASGYLLEIDGVGLPIPISRHMLVTVHSNRPGVLLVLLSALASRGVNVIDLQLGARGDKGFAVLGIQGDQRDIAEILPRLGPQYYEASEILLSI